MYIRTKDGKIYDLENKKVSSWEYIDNDTAINEYGVEGAFYTIYYFDENEGCYSEYDGKGGHSCDFIEEKDIIKQGDTIEELCDYLMFVDNDEKEDILITDVDEINITYSKNETCYACLKIKLPNGAIRIEPVAKFNEKWSFDLICL